MVAVGGREIWGRFSLQAGYLKVVRATSCLATGNVEAGEH